MTIEQAKQKVLTTINSGKELIDYHVIEDKHIVDHGFAWYIPFQRVTPTDLMEGGAYNGFFVDKSNGDMLRPGSSLPLKKWLLGFKIGLRYHRYNLHIIKTMDINQSVQLLRNLGLQYYIEELESGNIWKIPKFFTNKMLLERLQNLPTVFPNQGLTFRMDGLEEIIQSGIIEFKLEESHSQDNGIGENVTNKANS